MGILRIDNRIVSIETSIDGWNTENCTPSCLTVNSVIVLYLKCGFKLFKFNYDKLFLLNIIHSNVTLYVCYFFYVLTTQQIIHEILQYPLSGVQKMTFCIH